MGKHFIKGINCQGIGKIIYENYDPKWNFPRFHFIIFQDKPTDGDVCAFCMELGVEGYGSDSRDAIRNLIDSCNEFIEGLLTKEQSAAAFFQHLYTLAEGSHSEKFWEAYRLTEIGLAARARDIGNATIKDLLQEINMLMKKNQNLQFQINELSTWLENAVPRQSPL